VTDVVMTTVGAVLQRIEAGRSTQTLERPAQDGELGILRVSAVTWGEFRPGENKAMPLDYDPGNVPRPMKGDILISRANTRELVGAPVMVEADYPNLLLSDKILRLVPDCNIVEPRYLLRALRSSTAASHFSQCAGGTSGSMTNITQGDIRATPLRLPSLSEQRRIAAILDKADALRAKRREAIAKLDQLLQSVFLEMFGDPVMNPKGWPRLTFADLVRVKSGNGLTAQEMSPDGVYNVYGGNGVSGRHSEYMFEDPQIVIGRVGAYCGAVHRTEPKSWITDNALFVSQVLRPMNPRFLQEILSVANFNQYAGRAAQPLVSGSRIYPVETILPPISLQDEYASRIELILREMAKMSIHRHALEAMFSSLQHRSFAGAL
jgi:restriction endonuclease S subunit